MKIDVRLDAFEGPLDLLLHLIEKNKINIYDIPIVLITEQYMAYLAQMEADHSLDSLSEFLVMAATLLRIKSKMLIPTAPDEEEEDPREELVRRLVEYKMYKYAAGELKDLSVNAEKVYYKGSSIPGEIQNYTEPVDLAGLLGDTTLEKLNQTFQLVMRKRNDRVDPVRSRFGKIHKEKYRVEDRISQIRSQFRNAKTISFHDLLAQQPDKEMVVVTFLAVLEMMKAGQARASQEGNFGEIYIDLSPQAPSPAQQG